MDAARVVREIRRRGGWSLRRLADRAETSHSAIAAYEAGRTAPSVDTLERIVVAAGFELDGSVVRRVRGNDAYPRAQELLDVLELAEQFPMRRSRRIAATFVRRTA